MLRDDYGGRDLSVLDWIGRAPSWFAPLLSIGGILGGLAAWIISRRDRRSDVRRALESEWFRVLVFGEIVPHLLKFLSEQRAVFGSIFVDPKRRHVPNEYKNALNLFKESKGAVQRRLLLVRVISDDKYDEVISVVDEIDDAITLHCAANTGFPMKGQRDFKDFPKLDAEIALLSVQLFNHIKLMHRSVDGANLRKRIWSFLQHCSSFIGGRR
jgi:hypothetical protein